MKRFSTLFIYFFTNSSLILGALALGLVTIVLSLYLNPYFSKDGNPSAPAVAAMIVAYVMLLVVPYLGSARVVRMILGNRRLSLVPGLPLLTGFALFTLTLLTAAALPLGLMLLGAPVQVWWLAPYVLVVASLYSLGMQMLVTSRYLAAALNWLPLVLIAAVTLFRDALLDAARSAAIVITLALLTLACWIYALAVLSRKRDFKPWYPAHLAAEGGSGGIYMPAVTRWVETRRNQRISPAASLLFGYPASLHTRLWNVTGLLLLHPLLGVLLVHWMTLADAGDWVMNPVSFFLAMGILTIFGTTWTNYTETGARARMLWLRVPGARAQLWNTLEHALWTNFLLQLAVASFIALALVLYGQGSAFLLHYVLLIFIVPVYQCYLILCARLNQWSSLTYVLAIVASLAAIGYAVYLCLRFANFNVMLLVELGLLMCAALFRAIAKQTFRHVDWQVVRPMTLGQQVAVRS